MRVKKIVSGLVIASTLSLAIPATVNAQDGDSGNKAGAFPVWVGVLIAAGLGSLAAVALSQSPG